MARTYRLKKPVIGFLLILLTLGRIAAMITGEPFILGILYVAALLSLAGLARIYHRHLYEGVRRLFPPRDICERINEEIMRMEEQGKDLQQRIDYLHRERNLIRGDMHAIGAVSASTQATVLYGLQRFNVLISLYLTMLESHRLRRQFLEHFRKEIRLLRRAAAGQPSGRCQQLQAITRMVDERLRDGHCKHIAQMVSRASETADCFELRVLADQLRQRMAGLPTPSIDPVLSESLPDSATPWQECFEELELSIESLEFLDDYC